MYTGPVVVREVMVRWGSDIRGEEVKNKTIRKDWGFDELVLYNFMNRDDDGRVAGKTGKNIKP